MHADLMMAAPARFDEAANLVDTAATRASCSAGSLISFVKCTSSAGVALLP